MTDTVSAAATYVWRWAITMSQINLPLIREHPEQYVWKYADEIEYISSTIVADPERMLSFLDDPSESLRQAISVLSPQSGTNAVANPSRGGREPGLTKKRRLASERRALNQIMEEQLARPDIDLRLDHFPGDRRDAVEGLLESYRRRVQRGIYDRGIIQKSYRDASKLADYDELGTDSAIFALRSLEHDSAAQLMDYPGGTSQLVRDVLHGLESSSTDNVRAPDDATLILVLDQDSERGTGEEWKWLVEIRTAAISSTVGLVVNEFYARRFRRNDNDREGDEASELEVSSVITRVLRALKLPSSPVSADEDDKSSSRGEYFASDGSTSIVVRWEREANGVSGSIGPADDTDRPHRSVGKLQGLADQRLRQLLGHIQNSPMPDATRMSLVHELSDLFDQSEPTVTGTDEDW